MKADVAACQCAFAASKDPRDSYQAGIILGGAAAAQGLRHIAAQEAPVWVMAAGRCFHLVSIRRQQMRDMPPRATACCCCRTCAGIGRHLPACAKTCHRWGISAWRNAMTSGKALRPVLPASPVFVPLGALPFPQAQCLSRLASCPSRKPSVCPAWRPALPASPVFVPLGALPFPQIQYLSRLAPCPPANPVFVPLGAKPMLLLLR